LSYYVSLRIVSVSFPFNVQGFLESPLSKNRGLFIEVEAGLIPPLHMPLPAGPGFEDGS
jgi:hypothetical protein